MDQTSLLSFVAGVCRRLRVDYFITGSMASITYGEMRFTRDIDVVVRLVPADVTAFCQAFDKSDYYVSEDAAREAVRSGGQFDVIHPASGLKIDMICPQQTSYDVNRFERAVELEEGGERIRFAAPEDVILMKLRYYVEGGSAKHLSDITGILRVQGERINRRYIERWAATLDVAPVWDALLKELPHQSDADERT